MCGAGRRKEKYAGDGRRRTSTENGDTSFEKNNIVKHKFANLKNLVSTKMETTTLIKIMIIHVHIYGSRSIFENQLLFISRRLQK